MTSFVLFRLVRKSTFLNLQCVYTKRSDSLCPSVPVEVGGPPSSTNVDLRHYSGVVGGRPPHPPSEGMATTGRGGFTFTAEEETTKVT